MKIQALCLAAVPNQPLPGSWSFEIRACVKMPRKPSQNAEEIVTARTTVPVQYVDDNDAIPVIDVLLDSLVAEFKRELRNNGSKSK